MMTQNLLHRLLDTLGVISFLACLHLLIQGELLASILAASLSLALLPSFIDRWQLFLYASPSQSIEAPPNLPFWEMRANTMSEVKLSSLDLLATEVEKGEAQEALVNFEADEFVFLAYIASAEDKPLTNFLVLSQQVEKENLAPALLDIEGKQYVPRRPLGRLLLYLALRNKFHALDQDQLLLGSLPFLFSEAESVEFFTNEAAGHDANSSESST